MAGKTVPISFRAYGSDLFVLMLKNFFLTIITFGIYSFWAKIEVQKFMNRGTFIGDEPLDFHGTGKEKFIGFLKGAGVIMVIGLIANIIAWIAKHFIGEVSAQLLMLFILYGAFIVLAPIIIIGKKKYLFSRSSWRGVRFIFSGKWKVLAKIFVKGILLSVFTLGIYIPWFVYNIHFFMINNSLFGTERFVFKGDKGEYVRMVFKGFFLSIITLGIYSFWYSAAVERYLWSKTSIQKTKMSCSLTGGILFKMAIVNLLLVIFTLGFGAAWVIARTNRIYFGSLAIEGTVDFEAIKAAYDAKASAFADGLTDAADALDGLADMLG